MSHELDRRDKQLKTIPIIIEGDKATATGPFPFQIVRLIASLSGRKIWSQTKKVNFDASGANIRILKESGFSFSFSDRSGELAQMEEMESLPSQHNVPKLKTKYVPAVPWRKHQRDTLALSWNRRVYAHLHEMGLGKSAINLAEVAIQSLAGKVTGWLIIAPKGVHRQWIEEQIPEHINPEVKWRGIIWKQKEIDDRDMRCKGGLAVFAMNIDAIRTPKGFAMAEKFLKVHNGRSFLTLDESHKIKNWTADRTKAAWALGEMAHFKRIMTGTLLSRNIIDAWSQFKFLDVNILGHRYMTSFRNRYCVMGGFEGREIVGQRNVEEFYSLIAPHSFRKTKKEALDLPEKVYAPVLYEMGEETKRHYASLRQTFMTQLDEGEIVDVNNALAMLTRLQQVVCGYLPFDDEDDNPQLSIISDERLGVLSNICEQIEGKAIIWARFIPDGDRIMKRLAKEYGPESVVRYRGNDRTKKDAKEKFIKRDEVRWFVANQVTGGTGTDGLQKVCETAIFYSNSFNAIDRWQSEDRIHRMGMIGARYFDIICRASIDRHLLRNLKGKKSMSDLSLDTIRMSLREEEEERRAA